MELMKSANWARWASPHFQPAGSVRFCGAAEEAFFTALLVPPVATCMAWAEAAGPEMVSLPLIARVLSSSPSITALPSVPWMARLTGKPG